MKDIVWNYSHCVLTIREKKVYLEKNITNLFLSSISEKQNKNICYTRKFEAATFFL